MQPNPSSGPDDAVEAAIARVLDAETAARVDIVRARSEARQADDEARQAVRALATRNESRITAVRAAFLRQVDAEVTRLESEADALAISPALTEADLAMLERAVTVLAQQLTGTPR